MEDPALLAALAEKALAASTAPQKIVADVAVARQPETPDLSRVQPKPVVDVNAPPKTKTKPRKKAALSEAAAQEGRDCR